MAMARQPQQPNDNLRWKRVRSFIPLAVAIVALLAYATDGFEHFGPQRRVDCHKWDPKSIELTGLNGAVKIRVPEAYIFSKPDRDTLAFSMQVLLPDLIPVQDRKAPCRAGPANIEDGMFIMVGFAPLFSPKERLQNILRGKEDHPRPAFDFEQ